MVVFHEKVVVTVTETAVLVAVMAENVKLRASLMMDNGQVKEAQRESAAEEVESQGATDVAMIGQEQDVEVTIVEVVKAVTIVKAEAMRAESVEVKKARLIFEVTTKDLDACSEHGIWSIVMGESD